MDGVNGDQGERHLANEGSDGEGSERETAVLVIDDHRTFAEMLAAALNALPGMRCVGTAGSAAEGVAEASRLQPDIVVMDIQMPREDGLAATRRIREVVPDAVVAVVTAHTSPEWVAKAAQAGASAFIPKNGSLTDLTDILRSVRAGQMLVAPSTFATAPVTAPRNPAAPELSGRELDVLRLLAAGIPVKQMAPDLGITVNTCRGYVKSVRQKLDAGSQLEAVLRARQLGLLDEPGSGPSSLA
ncbi:response regulator transcription factor [uncultured Friedmanniella sp.]|uniref:response regulator transcription factor n=1 Tax=uncultured Friedmanniella sp. TaxID=335381 RepID=UPI0035CA09AB